LYDVIEVEEVPLKSSLCSSRCSSVPPSPVSEEAYRSLTPRRSIFPNLYDRRSVSTWNPVCQWVAKRTPITLSLQRAPRVAAPPKRVPSPVTPIRKHSGTSEDSCGLVSRYAEKICVNGSWVSINAKGTLAVGDIVEVVSEFVINQSGPEIRMLPGCTCILHGVDGDVDVQVWVRDLHEEEFLAQSVIT